VETIPEAQGFVGQDVLFPDEGLQPLENDEFYFFQIEGFSVVTVDGQKIGVVTDVMPSAGNDLMVVCGETGEILIPLTKTICVEINEKNGIVTIDPPEGLLDLNEI